MPGRERSVSMIPTKNPQPATAGAVRGRRPAAGSRGLGRGRSGGRGRPGGRVVSGVTRAGPGGRTVIETPEGITVYAARREGDRWRAVWYEDGERRQCQAATEDRMAASLEKVAVRLAADAPNMLSTGDELIAFYLSADRLPAERQWSRKHAETQRYLCERFVRPVLGRLVCQDIRVADMQAAVNAAPTAKEGRRVRAMLSALTGAGIAGGYLANPRLKEVHWQAKGRAVAPPRTVPAGESVLFVDPGEIPAAEDVVRLGQALAALRRGLCELMVQFAAYTGLRWGELAALTAAQVSPGARAVAVDRKVIEVRGRLYVEAPKNRKWRQAIYPSLTPHGWRLAEMVAARIAAAGAEQAAGANPLGLMFPAPAGGYWRSSNFPPPGPRRRLPGRRVARRRWRRPVDLAQPAARLLHRRAVRLPARRH
jgi:integrase